MINITPAQLRKAADLQEQIQELQHELNEILSGEVPAPAPQLIEEPKKKGEMSAAGRAAISAAAKARWAKVKWPASISAPTPPEKPAAKLKIKRSAAWKAAMSASAKARWAQIKHRGK